MLPPSCALVLSVSRELQLSWLCGFHVVEEIGSFVLFAELVGSVLCCAGWCLFLKIPWNENCISLALIQYPHIYCSCICWYLPYSGLQVIIWVWHQNIYVKWLQTCDDSRVFLILHTIKIVYWIFMPPKGRCQKQHQIILRLGKEEKIDTDSKFWYINLFSVSWPFFQSLFFGNTHEYLFQLTFYNT